MIRRYSVRNIEKIFSDQRRYENWLRIELSVLKYLSVKGLIPSVDVKKLASEIVILPHRIREEEKKTRHDVAAFVNYVSRLVRSSSGKWIHYGLTSSDLVDTSYSMMFRDANDEILKAARLLISRIGKLSIKYRESYCLNRELGRIEGITSFGYKLAYYYDEMSKSLENFERYRKYVECVSLTGSLGVCPYIRPKLQDFVAIDLKLYASKASTQTLSRDRYFKYFNLLGCLINSVNRLSLDLRLLAKTEIGEVAEYFHDEQIGSSSMPHKKNPISLENVCGLARLFNSYATSSAKSIELWLERDISHSSTDRVVFIDAITTAIQVMKRMFVILKKIHVDDKAMIANIRKYDFLAYKNIVRNTLIDYSKKSEHEVDDLLGIVQKISMERKISFEKAFKSTNLHEFIGGISTDVLFSPSYSCNNLEVLFKRIFAKSNQRFRFDELYYEQFEIEAAIEKMALRLNYLYGDSISPVQIIALREGSSMFLSHLLLKLDFELKLKTINLKLNSDKKFSEFFDKKDLKNKRILILDSVVRTGQNIDQIKDLLKRFGVMDVKVAALFSLNEKEILKDVDVYGLLIPTTSYLSGFGISCNGKYRNYPYIGRLKMEFV